MTTGEYLFNLIINAFYVSAWWSLFVFPDNSISELLSGIRLAFLGITSILMFWYVVEKLIKESRAE